MTRKPLIAINALTIDNQSGTGRYTHEIVRHLKPAAEEFKFLLYLPSSQRGQELAKQYSEESEISTRLIKIPHPAFKIFQEQITLPWLCYLKKVAILFNPAFVAPLLLRKTFSLVTIHDLAFLKDPQSITIWKRNYYRAFFIRSAHQAKRILVDSLSTKKDLQNLLQISEEKIDVVYPGVSEDFRPLKNDPKLEKRRKKYSLPKIFLLYAGTLEPRKNLPTLIRAYQILKHKNQNFPPLILVGRKGWFYEEIFQLARNEISKGDIIFTGYVPDEDLVYLYNLCTIFIYPSLYEGFGLPPLEAMACAKPVIAFENSSLAEVIGEAGLLISSESAESLAENIENLLSNPILQKDLSIKALKQSQKFSWYNTVAELTKSFKICLK